MRQPKLNKKQALALLYVFREAGAEQGAHCTTLQSYINQLYDAGFLCSEVRDVKNGERDFFVTLTDKGLEYLKSAGK